jgi:hypothetical protein
MYRIFMITQQYKGGQMKDYRGLIRLKCSIKKCIKPLPETEVQPSCVKCEKVKARIVDLEEKTLISFDNKKPKKKKE